MMTAATITQERPSLLFTYLKHLLRPPGVLEKGFETLHFFFHRLFLSPRLHWSSHYRAATSRLFALNFDRPYLDYVIWSRSITKPRSNYGDKLGRSERRIQAHPLSLATRIFIGKRNGEDKVDSKEDREPHRSPHVRRLMRGTHGEMLARSLVRIAPPCFHVYDVFRTR